MSMPWFLALLELPPHADERAVRRAYAARVKLIDPATDPAAFARLREAYEAARAWVTEEDYERAVDPSSPVTEPTPQAAIPPVAVDDATATPPPAPAPAIITVNPQEEALRLIDWLATRIAYGEASEIRRELEACTARLRLQYIDAPGIFEEVLIDRLARGMLRKRALVFDLATQHFHWQEIGHLAALGPRGMWIEAVESQRMAWSGIAPIFRANRLSLIERAEASNGTLPEQIVRRWSEVRDDFRRFPSYLGLYLDLQRQQEWASCYDALPAPERQALEAPPALRRKRFFSLEARQRMRGFLVLAMTGVVVYLAVSNANLRDHPEVSGTSGTHATQAAVPGTTGDLDVTISESQAPGQDKRWVVVTLTNRSPARLYLDKALTPPMTAGTHLARPLFTVFDPHGIPVAFAHRAMPDPPRNPATAFLQLEPGQTLSKSFDLGFDYKLVPGVTYRVSYRQPVSRTLLGEGSYVDSNVLTAKVEAPHADPAPPPR